MCVYKAGEIDWWSSRSKRVHTSMCDINGISWTTNWNLRDIVSARSNLLEFVREFLDRGIFDRLW